MKKITKQSINDDKISSGQNYPIPDNNSSSKKTKKLKIDIQDQNPSIQSQIQHQRQQNRHNFVNENVISAKKRHYETTSPNKPFQQQQPYRFTINHNNRQSFLPSKGQKFFKKIKSSNQNDYNHSSEDAAIGKKFLIEHLKSIECQAGDYVEIKINNLRTFAPVYKVINLTSGNIDDMIDYNNSRAKSNKLENNMSNSQRQFPKRSLIVSNPINQQQSSFELTMGSKIFLKHQKFTHLTQFTVNRLNKLPLLHGIYVNIYIKDQGYLICTQNEKNIKIEILQDQVDQGESEKSYVVEFNDYEDGDKIQGIWRCVLEKTQSQKYQYEHINEEERLSDDNGQEKFVVSFMNLQSGMFLKIGDNGKFQVTEQNDIGTRLLLKAARQRNSQGNEMPYKFIVKRLSVNINNGYKHIPYEQSKNQRNADNLQFSFEMTQIDQSIASLQQQLLYIKSKLKHSPSLKLIEVTLQTLLPYFIFQFLPNVGIVSEYIQKVFVDEKITQRIVNFLIEWVGNVVDDANENGGLDQIKETDEDNEQNAIYETYKKPHVEYNLSLSRRKSQSSPQHDDLITNPYSYTFLKISKYLNKLCMNSQSNTVMFFSLVDRMFSNPSRFYSQIIALVEGNMLFVSQFYQREWYQQLIMLMLQRHRLNRFDEQNTECEEYFMLASVFCQTIPFPSAQNQFLLLHTINQPQFQSRNMLLNLYVQGQYIFVRDKEKDMQLLTFLQSRSSNIIVNVNNNRLSQQTVRQSAMSVNEQKASKRVSLLQKSSTFLGLLHKVLLYLQTISFLTYGHNQTILKLYNPIIQRLLSYCNKQSPLVIKDYDFTRWVLKCAYSFYHQSQNIKISPRYRLGIVDSPNGEGKFKQKVFISSYGIMTTTIGGSNKREKNNTTIRMDEKVSLQLVTQFLNRCKEYYMLIKSNKIRISQLFQTKAIYGQPIEQYFDFLKLIFTHRLLKFKQKKKAQFMQYIEKLFENVFPQQEKVQQSEQSLIIIFVKFLLRIISYDENYSNYLEKLKINTLQQQPMLHSQLNINKKSTMKNIKILPDSTGQCSKIMKIKLLNRFFEKQGKRKMGEGEQQMKIKDDMLEQKQPPLLKTFQQPLTNNKKTLSRNQHHYAQSNINNTETLKPLHFNSSTTEQTLQLVDLISQSQQQQKYLTVKRRALELIVVIMQNTNEQFIQQSIETLNYFIKNPTRLNLSSFELFQSIPKYETEFNLRKRIMQQWYLTSQPQTFQLLTTLLRMLHRKVTIHLNSISQVQIITDSQLGQMSTFIADNCRQVQKLSLSLQSWFKQQLYTQNIQLFGYFDQKLQNVVETLSKCRQLTDCGCVSVNHQLKKLIVSFNCFDWGKLLIKHISKQLQRLKKLSTVNVTKTRLTTIKAYHKAILSYLQKLTFIITFLIQTIPLQKLLSSSQSTPVYLQQFEYSLYYMQAILCIFGEDLVNIDQMKWIIIKIVSTARQCYNVNLMKYFTDNMWLRVIKCKWTIGMVFQIIEHFSDYELVHLSKCLSKVFISLKEENRTNPNNTNKQTLKSITMNLIYGPYHSNQKQPQTYHNNNPIQNFLIRDEFMFTNNSKTTKTTLNNPNNEFLYFLYRLIQLSVKHQTPITPIVRIFLQEMLVYILQQQPLINNQSIKTKKSSRNIIIKNQHLSRIQIDIQRKRYIAYMIWQLVSSQDRRIIKSNINQELEQKLPSIRSFITHCLLDITIYQQLQKTLHSQDIKLNTTYYYNLTSLLLQYLEFYCYDLVSLLHMLQPTDQFEKIYINLNKVNDKLRSFLADKTAVTIQTHYPQSTILKVIQLLQQKVQITKMKPPRAAFQPSTKPPKQLNIKSIFFMTRRQQKKLQSTALRKWTKAIKILQQQSLISQSQLLYEIDHFSEIYSIKNKQQLTSVINNEDLLRKLISVVCNMKRVIKQTENKIFLLVEINKLFVSKYFSNLVNMNKTREILAQMILEQLNQQEIYDNSKEGNSQGYKHNTSGQNRWTESVFVICLKLETIKRLQYFAHQYTLNSLEILFSLLRKAIRSYFSDSLKITITAMQFKQVPWLNLEPLYVLLTIIVEQVAFQSLGNKQLEIILDCLYSTAMERCWGEEMEWIVEHDEKKFGHKKNRLIMHKRLHQRLLQKLSKQPRAQPILQSISKKYHQPNENNPQLDHLYYPLIQKIERYNNNRDIYSTSYNEQYQHKIATVLNLVNNNIV